MLISYPILETPQANDTEETLLARMLARATDPGGQYPAKTIGEYKVWHGGLHLDATNATPIRAIADGTIVAYRQAKASEQYQGQPYDTSFVLIKHETETGENTPVVFYSLYMHLACRDDLTADRVSSLIPLFQQASAIGTDAKSPPTATPPQRKLARVYRRDILGYPGLQYSLSNRRIHFEVFTTDEHLPRFWKDSSTATNQTASKDFYGEAHFIIPANKPFAARHPNAAQPHRIEFDTEHFYDLPVGQAGTSSEQLIVSVRLDKGTRTASTYVKQGDAYRALGSGTAGTPVVQSDYEYELFRLATALYPDCPSAGFEWLRFGRILSSDTTTHNQNWQLVRYSDSAVGYIDLAQADVIKLSDADFPFWRGWEKIEEGQLASPSDAFVDDPHALTLLNNTTSDSGRKKLQHLVVKHPSEWDASDLATRYAKLKAAGKPLASQESWNAFEDHVQKMAFWDKTGGLTRSVWHFHPLEFIFHFRKCGWRSKNELLQLIPDHVIRKPGSHNSPSNGVWEPPNIATASNFLDRHRIELCKSLRKFSIETPIRQACFFGNATQETGWFKDLRESGGLNPSLHLGWYGRGFLQLTNKDGNIAGGNNNYYKYFKFLGRNPHTPPTTQEIHWRDEIGQASKHGAASAGAYWIWHDKAIITPQQAAERGLPDRRVGNANKYADNIGTNLRKTIHTNAGIKVWYYNQSFVNCAASVNYPSSTGQTPPNMNGLVDRSTSFVNSLMVLCDISFFQTENGQTSSTPENFHRRELP